MISMGNSLPSLRRADELDPGADLLRQRVGSATRTVGDETFRKALRNDVLDRLPEQLVAAVSELLLRLHVEQDDFSGQVHDHHGIGSGFQQPAITALQLGYVFFASSLTLMSVLVPNQRCTFPSDRGSERPGRETSGISRHGRG